MYTREEESEGGDHIEVVYFKNAVEIDALEELNMLETRIEALDNDLMDVIAANHSVAVCSDGNHIREITEHEGCLVCDFMKLQFEIKQLKEAK